LFQALDNSDHRVIRFLRSGQGEAVHVLVGGEFGPGFDLIRFFRRIQIGMLNITILSYKGPRVTIGIPDDEVSITPVRYMYVPVPQITYQHSVRECSCIMYHLPTLCVLLTFDLMFDMYSVATK